MDLVMLGTFQESSIRIEVHASEKVIRESLTQIPKLKLWLSPQRLSTGLPEELHEGLTFTSWIGPITIQHKVEQATHHSVCLLLTQGIDGFHEWRWGDGWVQSRIEGISLLPIGLAQTLNLMRLRQFLLASNS